MSQRNNIIQYLCRIRAKNMRVLISKVNFSNEYKKLKTAVIELTNYLPDNCRLSERLYHLAYGLESRPLCKTCGQNHTKFISFKEGYQQYCGTKCSNRSKEVKQKKQLSCIKKYGVSNVFQCGKIKKKIRSQLLKKYNVENISQSEEIKKKKRETTLKNFGVLYPMQSEQVKEKSKQTCLEKYGVENPKNSSEAQEKSKQTNLEKYGVSHPLQSPEIREKVSKTHLLSNYNYIISSKRIGEDYECLTSIEEYNGVKYEYLKFKHKECGHIFEYSLRNGSKPRCPKCYANKSRFEEEVRKFCEKYFDNIIYNNRKIISPQELDIYIPEIKLAIECNGMYWHREESKGKYYHQQKLIECWKHHIYLLQIFDDEWKHKQSIVKSMLLNRFGKTPNYISAKKCQIFDIQNDYSEKWLEDNHLQGPIKGQHYGLVYNNQLVSIISVGRPRFNTTHNLEIYRFCNVLNTDVVGGLSHLFEHVLKKYNNPTIITYTDLRYGVDQSYKKIGFKYTGVTEPEYFYVKSQTKYNRNDLQHILEYFDPNLTEEQNMYQNGYFRVFDCGAAVFELT